MRSNFYETEICISLYFFLTKSFNWQYFRIHWLNIYEFKQCNIHALLSLVFFFFLSRYKKSTKPTLFKYDIHIFKSRVPPLSLSKHFSLLSFPFFLNLSTPKLFGLAQSSLSSSWSREHRWYFHKKCLSRSTDKVLESYKIILS